MFWFKTIIYLVNDYVKNIYSLLKVSLWLSCFTVLDSQPVRSLHGFPHDAPFPSHTQKESLGKNLNVNLTVRERLCSMCDGRDWLTGDPFRVPGDCGKDWVGWDYKWILTFSPSSTEMGLCKCFAEAAVSVNHWELGLQNLISIICSVGIQQIISNAGQNGGRSTDALEKQHTGVSTHFTELLQA